MPVFVDTNILLYAVSCAPQEAAKTQVARALLQGGEWRLSVQVLQEFYVNAVRKLARPLSQTAALRFIECLTRSAPTPTDLPLMLLGIRICRRYELGYWDGAVIAAAQRCGCRTLYSEDLSHGQWYGDVQVINPFTA